MVDDPFFVRNLSAPFLGIMRFHLVYNGRLAATANHPKPNEARKIREQLSPQLETLWKTHHSLKELKVSAWVPKKEFEGRLHQYQSPFTDHNEEVEKYKTGPLKDMMQNLCEDLSVGDHIYKPLVRKSLDLNCSLEILFLRQCDPGSLISNGGDLDNRIKTLLDGLRMPNKQEQDAADPPTLDPIYCLLESDFLISDMDISTDRLLFSENDRPQTVHLVIAVTVNVLRVGLWNQCLM